MRRRLRRLFVGGRPQHDAKSRRMASLELWLASGEKLHIRVEDHDAELAALKNRSGRFAHEFAELTGPALGVVRVEAIIAVVVR